MVQAAEERISPVRGANLWPMSVEAYHVLGEAGVISENTELLYGLVYTKAPKSPFHTVLVARLFRLLIQLNLPGIWVRSEAPLTISDSEPEPDISLIAGNDSDFGANNPATAELVMEVCVTSHEYDRSKLRAYAMANVKECWLILAPEKQIEVYTHPRDGVFTKKTLHGPGGTLQSHALPDVSINLAVLFPA